MVWGEDEKQKGRERKKENKRRRQKCCQHKLQHDRELVDTGQVQQRKVCAAAVHVGIVARPRSAVPDIVRALLFFGKKKRQTILKLYISKKRATSNDASVVKPASSLFTRPTIARQRSLAWLHQQDGLTYLHFLRVHFFQSNDE